MSHMLKVGGHGMIDRRHTMALLGGSLSFLLDRAGAAQESRKLPVLGVLGSGSAEGSRGPLAELRAALAQSGFVEGETIAIEYRWAENRYERLAEQAADLVRRHVAVIIAAQGTAPPIVAKAATTTIPIVFTGVSDPVRFGLVASLARPGGNLTGVSILGVELDGKRFELMHAVAPAGARIAALLNPNRPEHKAQVSELEAAAIALGRQLVVVTAGGESELDAAFATIVREGAGALVVAADPFFTNQREEIAALAARNRVPAIYQWRDFVDIGGLIGYGPSRDDAWRHAGLYAARILKGEKPADLPVIQSAKIELIINLKTANALGVTFPPSILVRADEIIE